ncbi:unnamed protein product, partial [Heterotrigona itama]
YLIILFVNLVIYDTNNIYRLFYSEVCKALNKNRGLYGRWTELQDVVVTSSTPLLDNSPARVPVNHGTTKYSKLENEIDSPNRQFLNDTLQQQNDMIRQQDEQLDMIGESIGTLKTVSRQINTELDEQAVMLDEFGNELEVTDSKLDATMKKMAKVLHMSNGNYNNYIPAPTTATSSVSDLASKPSSLSSLSNTITN